MDYCSTCRRHLNGALVCPGCGAYAPDIAPPPVLSAATAPAAEPYGIEEAPVASPSAPVQAPAPAGPNGQGRAARRRQLARWKKNKRRAAAGTVIALVGGALTVAALPTESREDQAHAAAAPDTTLPDAAMTHRPATVPAQPKERASRPPQQAAPAATAPAAPQQRTTAPRTAAAPTPTRPARTASAAPEAPEPPKAPAPVPTTTAPAAPAEPPAAAAPAPDEPQARPTQTATTSPTQVCLLVLCVG